MHFHMTHVAFVFFPLSQVTAEYRVTDEILLLEKLYRNISS